MTRAAETEWYLASAILLPLALLLVVAILAWVLPARRAADVDAVAALRDE